MGDVLDKLIEAVEAGETLPRPLPFPAYQAAYVIGAYDGSLDAAMALHEVLLGAVTYGWGAGPWGARVWLFSDHPQWDGSVRQDVELVNQPARALLLAILRAYRQHREA
ncbi:hypothetical protein NM680_13320 [Paracoccus sp. PS-1]|uniref:hypothetical protein n=1 Tax=Paracoccus sp. PS1 TaxID=2963938 RepID=UPI0027E4991E|nr:hypothetical protein [Paracoccus sp. PS1]MDQ7262773.1 hypothetical protein [Paracoccus sp. PS1]